MAKLSGYRKLVKWIRIGDDFKKVSTETRAESVIMADGENLEDKLSSYKPASSGTADYATTAGTANSVAWENVSNKPDTYTPASHNHDDKYYTETEIDNKLKNYSTAKFSFSNGTLTITDQ